MIALLPIAFIGGGIALAIWLVTWAKRVERERLEAMQAVAAAMGFRFEPESKLWHELDLPLFTRGHGQQARNVMIGETASHAVTVMDFRYVVGHGKNRQHFRHSVAVFHNLGRGMPAFDLSPENIFHRIGQVFGYQDIDFDSHEEFSKQYLLRGEDESAIRAMFGPQVLAFLAGEPGWSAQARGERLVVFQRTQSEPAQIPAFLADCLRIASGLGRN